MYNKLFWCVYDAIWLVSDNIILPFSTFPK